MGEKMNRYFFQRRSSDGQQACEKILNISNQVNANQSHNDLSHYTYQNCCCCLATKSCLTLCNPMDCSPPGSSVQGISQARILESVAISFSGDLPDPRIKPLSPA